MQAYLSTHGKFVCLSPSSKEDVIGTTFLWPENAESSTSYLERSSDKKSACLDTFHIGANSKGEETRSDLRDPKLVQLYGLANEFKEGDAALGLAAPSEVERAAAKEELSRLKLGVVTGDKFLVDAISRFNEGGVDASIADRLGSLTFGELKTLLLTCSAEKIRKIMPGLRSEVIAGVAKLMANDELIRVSNKIYNNSANGCLGSEGCFSSRIQPNSATDDPEEVFFSVLEGLSYGCGDAIFGINIVASDSANIETLELTLKDIVETLGLQNVTKWCVLAHIDDQVLVERRKPGSLDCAFQSIGGNETINSVFNVSVKKLRDNLELAKSQYFETGQGSAATNGAACGVDMVTLEARAHGFARALSKANNKWTIVNTVAGFIGPEVFKSKEQLLRACLEDLFMGKLHGLVFGLDICSTYHMSLEIEEMFWIQDSVMAAGPAFYMAVAGNSDPMLSYLTTSYRDHPRLRSKHGKSVTDAMQRFLKSVGVMDSNGKLTDKAGNTEWMYVCYHRAKNSTKSDAELVKEARERLERLQKRGLDLGYGHDGHFRAPKTLQDRLRSTYNEAKRVIFTEFSKRFTEQYSEAITLKTKAKCRVEYCSKPVLGELLLENSVGAVLHPYACSLWRGIDTERKVCVQVVFSDGLNPSSVDAPGHADTLFEHLKEACSKKGYLVASNPIIIENGRVRAGYAVGSELFSAYPNIRVGILINLIGERPGNGKNTFSAYVACATSNLWARRLVNHHCVDVVSGISTLALSPIKAVDNVLYFVDRRLDALPQETSL